MGKLIIIRHGQTDMNAEKLFFGKLDPSLNSQGREQALLARNKLEKLITYDRIYSSDLKRASETAAIINYLDKEIEYDKRLQELNFGIFEGLKYREIQEKYPLECEKSKKDWKNYNYETGESPKDLQKRAIEFIETLDLEKDNVIVTHWGIICSILSWYFSNELESYWKFFIENGGIVIIEFKDRFPILRGLNI